MIDPNYISKTSPSPGGQTTDQGPGDDLLGPTEFGQHHGIPDLDAVLSAPLNDAPTPVTQPAGTPEDTLDEKKEPHISSEKQRRFMQLAAAGKLDPKRMPRKSKIPNPEKAKKLLAGAKGKKLPTRSNTRHARYKRKMRGQAVNDSVEPRFIALSEEFLRKLDSVLGIDDVKDI